MASNSINIFSNSQSKIYSDIDELESIDAVKKLASKLSNNKDRNLLEELNMGIKTWQFERRDIETGVIAGVSDYKATLHNIVESFFEPSVTTIIEAPILVISSPDKSKTPQAPKTEQEMAIDNQLIAANMNFELSQIIKKSGVEAMALAETLELERYILIKIDGESIPAERYYIIFRRLRETKRLTINKLSPHLSEKTIEEVRTLLIENAPKKPTPVKIAELTVKLTDEQQKFFRGLSVKQQNIFFDTLSHMKVKFSQIVDLKFHDLPRDAKKALAKSMGRIIVPMSHWVNEDDREYIDDAQTHTEQAERFMDRIPTDSTVLKYCVTEVFYTDHFDGLYNMLKALQPYLETEMPIVNNDA